MTPIDEKSMSRDSAAYTHVGFVLLGGLLISITVMSAGLIASAVVGGTAATVLPLDRVPARLGQGDANAILDLGILLLFATPLAGILTALVEFWIQRDRTFVLVTMGLLAMLAIAFAVALH